jgi:hypothetical protein
VLARRQPSVRRAVSARGECPSTASSDSRSRPRTWKIGGLA